MNLLVHFVIYGHSSCFQSSQTALAVYYILNKITQTHYFVRVTYYIKRFNGFQYAHMFYLNQSEI